MVPCHHTCHRVFLYALCLAHSIPVQVKKRFFVQGGNLSTLFTGHSLFRLPLSGTTFLLTPNTAVLSHSSELLLKLFSLFLPTLTLSQALDAVLDLILILLLLSSLAGWWFSVVVMICVCVCVCVRFWLFSSSFWVGVRPGERGGSEGLRDCVYVCWGVWVRVCACVDAGEEGYGEICNTLLNYVMYCCNVSCIVLWTSHMYSHSGIQCIRNALIIIKTT